MALRKESLTIRFAGGVDTKQDAKAVPTTKLLALENGVFTKAVSIVKRNGYQDLSLAIDGQIAPIAGATRTAKRDTELLAFTRTRGYSYDPEADRWADGGAVFSVVGNDAPLVRTGTQQTMSDQASAGGVTAVAWEDSLGGLWWSSISSSTGRVYRAPELLDAGGSRPRCVPCGDVLHVYWTNGARIWVAVVNPARPSTAVTPKILTEDLSTANPVYDAEETTYPGAPVFMAWAELATGFLRIAFIHPSGVIGGPATSLPLSYHEMGATVTGAIAVSTRKGLLASKLVVVAIASGIATYFYYQIQTIAGVDSLLLLSSAGFAVTNPTRVTAVMLDGTDAGTGEQPVWIACEQSAAQASERTTYAVVINATTPNSRTIRSVGLASRGFQIEGEAFATFVHDTTYFNTCFAIRLSDGLVVGRVLPGLAAGAPAHVHLPSAHVVGDVVSLALPYRERLKSANSDKFTETGIRALTLDFNSDASHQSAQLGRGLYIAGASPVHYDGHAFAEHGFHVGPELVTAAPDAAAGSMTSSLTYEYIAWYEATDGQGEIDRGPESFGTTLALGVSDKEVVLTLPTLRLTAKQNVRICVARTKGNDASAFYRVTSLDPSTAGQPNGYIANNPAVDHVSFTDRMSDATLGTQEPLYTNGGILSNDMPALGAAIAVGKSRLFFSDPSDPNVVRFSQEIDVGYAAEMPPELVIRCDPYGGAITALAVMDDQIIIFKEHALYVVGGEGPLPNGDSSQTGFSNPQLITSDVGCTDPQSIAIIPLGLVFKSAKGIFLVDRSKTVSYVGAPVEAYNTQTIRRATLIQDRTQVVFLTSSGKTLLYDYLFGQWSTFTNHEGYDAQEINGLYHYLRTDGRVFRETPGICFDGGAPIPLRFETAWIKLADHLQGFARFYHLHAIGGWKSPHQLIVQAQVDYIDHWSGPIYFDATNAALGDTTWVTGPRAGAIGVEPIAGSNYGDGPYGDNPYGGTPTPIYQWRVHLGIVGQAIRFRFEDYQSAATVAAGVAATPSAPVLSLGGPGGSIGGVNQSPTLTGASFELSEILITGGVKGPTRKPYSAARSM